MNVEAEAHNRWKHYRSEPIEVTAGWDFSTLMGPSPTYGANGMCFGGPDNRLYVAEVIAAHVTAFDTDTGAFEPHSRLNGGLRSPDDLIFLADGTMAATDVAYGQVSARHPDGTYRIIAEGLGGCNGITTDPETRERLFVNCNPVGEGGMASAVSSDASSGTLWEVDPSGSGERTLLMDRLPSVNGMAFGPDGALYFPMPLCNEIWRYDFTDRRGRRAVDQLDIPTALKFDSHGRLVTTVYTGRIVRVDLATGERAFIGEVPRGVDNLAISPDDRVFVSQWVDGRVTEVTDGMSRVLSPSGLLGPWGVWCRRDGTMLVADMFTVAIVDNKGEVLNRPVWLAKDLLAAAIGVCALGDDLVVLTEGGGIHLYDGTGYHPKVLAAGLADVRSLYAEDANTLLVAEPTAGRITRIRRDGHREVVAEGFSSPNAVCRDRSGNLFVSQGGGAPLVMATAGGGRKDLVGLTDGHGVAVSGDTVVVIDGGAHLCAAVDIASGRAETTVRNLPVGLPIEGVMHNQFASVAADWSGGFVVGCNGDGSLRSLRRA